MNKPQRNHNPLDLRFAKQTEATGQDQDGFAVFANDPAGFRAGHAQILLDQQRGLTVRQFINKFAPPSENDTEGYLGFIIAHMAIDPKYIKELPTGGWVLDPDAPLSGLSELALAGIMAFKEGYFAK